MSQPWLFGDVMAASPVMPGVRAEGSGAGCALCRARGTVRSQERSGCPGAVQVMHWRLLCGWALHTGVPQLCSTEESRGEGCSP